MGVPEGRVAQDNRDRAVFALARPVRPRRLKSPPGPLRLKTCAGQLTGDNNGNDRVQKVHGGTSVRRISHYFAS